MKFFVLCFFLLCFSYPLFSQEDVMKIHRSESLRLYNDSLKNDLKMPLKELIPHEKEAFDKYGLEMEKEKDLSAFYSTLAFPEKSKMNHILSSGKKFVVPAVFISYGILAQECYPIKQLDRSTGHEVDEHFQKSMPYDDYLQFAPAVAVYGLDWMGVKSKHNIQDRTIVLATSYLLMTGAVHTLKNTTNVWRPDNSARNSFPSGHTATAFVGAHVLFREYYDTSHWIGLSGYLASSVTGAMRVMNKRHWVSDVVTGAGIGILSVETSYMLLPVMNKVFHPHNNKSDKTVSIAPAVSDKSVELGLVCVF
jgi:hypothetical protein